MIRPDRTKVLWLGSRPSRKTLAATKAWGLDMVAGDRASADVRDRTLRCVIVPFSVRSIGSLRPTLVQLLPMVESGALLAVAAVRPPEFAIASTIADYIERESPKNYRRIRVIGSSPDEVCRACAYHDPGPSVDNELEIAGDSSELTPVDEILIRRAFARSFNRVEIHKQSGGRSPGSRVWSAVGYQLDGRTCEPFVIKTGPRPAILEEYQTTNNFVLDFVSFPFRPPFGLDAHVVGGERSLLASMFVERAQRFDSYITGVKNPRMAVAALFDGALFNLRRDVRTSMVSLGQMYVDRQQAATKFREQDERLGRPYKSVLPDPSRLHRAHRVAQALGYQVPEPNELWQALLKIPSTMCVECRCHGDLNARNLFVRFNGIDVILIDFSHAGEFGPLSQDPARLEVSVAFDVRSETGLLSDAVLERLYASPLLPSRGLWGEDGRIEAVQQLRLQVGGEGVSNVEYEVSVAAHLLRQARSSQGEDTSGSRAESWRLKGLAYALAARLIGGIVPA